MDLEQRYNQIAILIADAYIEQIGLPKVEDLLKEEGAEFKENQLYAAHLQAIQKMFQDEFKIMGLDLVSEVEKNNETFILGQLSNYEEAILRNRIDELAFVIKKVGESL